MKKLEAQTGVARTIIQVVRVEWSKAARGGPLASLRNRVPVALPFKASGFEAFEASETMWIEEQIWGEPDFARAHRVQRSSKSGDFQFQGLVVRHLSNATSVAGTPQSGAPTRRASAHTDLQPEQQARLRWNGRFSIGFDSYWSYEQVTLNIARIIGEMRPDIFTAREPDFSFESLARLR